MNWYQDRNAAELPIATVVSVPADGVSLAELVALGMGPFR